ncbi:Copper amine oxidase N-terminal domain-containing protein [Geosporobacter subterraneus DSM 17957]|uniref:Copper amine oxidase N-terminal domain-containing protein n=1 Tax=Geosporobacter subterraneus DSM 17957 TaxID=1121919 RepID=A0A1M6P6C4_9FIRM|nr:stalk domain-containing protein [Geosporobacter subterraneus]SHK03521.1 Copper amine oxidase N-terminal domain-containing protein [Geosporobacter subterraneus DSM 17957]
MKSFKIGLQALIMSVLMISLISINGSALNDPSLSQKTIQLSLNGMPSDPLTALFFKDHIYVPIGFIAEQLGCKVDWNSRQQRLSISSSSAFKDFEEANPLGGERFVYGEILSVDLDNRQLNIEEHYDDQYVYVEPNLMVLSEAVIILQRKDKAMNLDFEDLKIGDVVGLVLNKEGKVRGIILSQ